MESGLLRELLPAKSMPPPFRGEGEVPRLRTGGSMEAERGTDMRGEPDGEALSCPVIGWMGGRGDLPESPGRETSEWWPWTGVW
mmetsp:Transcript_13175/g.20679  ORF Transcript_13175/g.20679 Transcript_13175/m.20679 type:complete len:84 (-) Transcript_13175:867-1118(-)